MQGLFKATYSIIVLLRIRGNANGKIHGIFFLALRRELCSLLNTSSAAIYSPVARACSREANPLAINNLWMSILQQSRQRPLSSTSFGTKKIC
ncbi:MAG: hypothetical protein WCL46_07785 [Chlorobium sp.]